MSRKSRGCDYERKLVHLLYEKGYWAVRVAGSGSSKYPSPDIIASNGKITLSIEVKSTQSGFIYLKKETVKRLIEFSDGFNSKPIIAVHFLRKGWFYLNANSLIKLKTIKLTPENMNRQI